MPTFLKIFGALGAKNMSFNPILINFFWQNSQQMPLKPTIASEMSYRNGVPPEIFLWERRSYAFPCNTSLGTVYPQADIDQKRDVINVYF